MPGFDGFEVMTYIRREPKLEKIPVCIISSESQEEYVRKAKELGAIGYIVKPIGIEQLEKALRAVRADKKSESETDP